MRLLTLFGFAPAMEWDREASLAFVASVTPELAMTGRTTLQEAHAALQGHVDEERRDEPPRVRTGLRGDAGVLAEEEQDLVPVLSILGAGAQPKLRALYRHHKKITIMYI